MRSQLTEVDAVYGYYDLPSYSEGRRCAVCNSPITDDNPDGIGCTCREVWEKAFRIAFYHFHGLEIWKVKSRFWVDIFLKTFETTKFRSKFRKSFYASVKDMNEKGELRLSRKMFDIIRSAVVGEECDFGRPPWKAPNDYNKLYEEEKQLVVDLKRKLWDKGGMSDEENEYVCNLAKKYYNENRQEPTNADNNS